MSNAITPTIFQELCLPEDFQQQNPHVFNSIGSLRWNIRQNRDEYRVLGALVPIGRRVYIRPQRFAEAVVEISARRAAERLNAKVAA